MCRFPGLLTIGGLLLVIGAMLVGLAPTGDGPSPEPVRISLRADHAFDSFLPPAMFAESPRDVVRMSAKKEASLTLARVAKPAVAEVAMMGDGVENGPPFRR